MGVHYGMLTLYKEHYLEVSIVQLFEEWRNSDYIELFVAYIMQ